MRFVFRTPNLPALGSRDFRYFWIGNVVSVAGQQMWWLAEPWVIYELSGSKLLLGLNGLAQAVPATLLSLYGGVIADRFDQRKVLIVAQTIQAAILGVLAVISFMQLLTVWHVMTSAFLLGATGAFEGPARHALFPALTERRYLANAVALNATVHPGTRIISPTIAGFLLAAVMGTSGSASTAAGVIFAVAGGSLLVMVWLLLLVHMPPVRRSQSGNVVTQMAGTVRFIFNNRIFVTIIGTAYFTQFFGNSAQVMFPVFAKDILHVGPSGLGFMYTAMGIGSFMGAAASASLTSPRIQRRLLIGGAIVLGTFLALFAMSSWYPLSLFLLWCTGLGASTLNVAVQANLQMLVPDDFRGRVMSVWGMVHTGIRPMGEMEVGGLAAATSAPLAVVVSGVAVLVFTGLVLFPNKQVRQLGDLRAQKMADLESSMPNEPGTR